MCTPAPDTTPPAVGGHGDVNAEATGPSGAVVTYTNPSATDDRDGSIPVSCSPASGSTFNVGSTLVSCTATDAAGNTTITSFTVFVADTTPPTVDPHADDVAEATSHSGAVVNYATPSASDIVDGAVAVSCSPASGSTFALGATQVTCTARDAAGNTGTSSFRVLVRDTTPPAIATHADEVAEASGPTGAVVNYLDPAASDLVDGSVAVSCSPASGTTFALGTTPVTCTATDAAGNTATSTFNVLVHDTTPPAIAPHANEVVEATGPSGATVSYMLPAATDVVDGAVSVTCAPAAGTTFALGETLVTCSAQDAAGNTASSSFSVIVRDTTPPAIGVRPDLIVEATDASGADVTYTAPTATDLVDGTVAVSCAPTSGSTFALGATLVTCTAADAAGNAAASTFTVTVRDTTAPTISAHADVTSGAISAAGARVSYVAPTATDLVDGNVSVTCAPASASVFPLGATVVSCSAQDAAGNSASSSFTVNVVDYTPPNVSVPADIATNATSAGGANVTFTATAGDNVDGSVAVNCSPSSGSLFPVGTTVVTCTAQDAAGNVANATFNVSVTDSTPPTVANHGTVTAEATGPSGAVVNYVPPSASDLVDGGVSVSCSPASGSTFPLGSTLVTCIATDSSGNTGSGDFTVIVRDTTKPSIASTAAIVREATSSAGRTTSYTTPPATDLVDGSVPVNCSPASGSTFPLGVTTVTCNAIDAAGNTATSTFTIAIRDTTKPSISAHADVVVEATSAGGAAVSYTVPTANDIVDGTDTVTCSAASGSTFALGTTTVNCSATDAAGNTATSSFNVVVRDTTAPVIAARADIVQEATSSGGATVSYVAPTASDSVSGTVTVTCTPTSGSVFGLGTTIVTCTARDAAGNTSTSTFRVTVRDTTAPALSAHANVTLEATSRNGATVTYTLPTAADAVDGSVPVTCAPASGTLFALGTTLVTCTARDAAGNVGTRTFNVIVRDTTPPVLSAHANLVADATRPSGASVTYTLPTANDVVDGSVAVTCAPASGATFAIGTTTVTCTARDAAGNTGTSTFTISIKSAAAQLADLNGLITGMNINPGFTNSLTGQVNAASTEANRTPPNYSGAASALNSMLKQILDELTKSNPKITIAQSRQIAAKEYQIQSVMGTVSASSPVPGGVDAALALMGAIPTLGAGSGTTSSLLNGAHDAATFIVDGNLGGACTSLQQVQNTSNTRLNGTQQATLQPYIDAPRSTIGC